MKGQSKPGSKLKAQDTQKTLEEPKRPKPQVVISVPKNFDRSKYIIPQIRPNDEESDVEVASSKKKDRRARFEEIESDDEVPRQRPFDKLKPLEKVPQPKDFALPGSRDNSLETKSPKERVVSSRAEEIRKAIRSRPEKEVLSDDSWKVVREKSVDEVTDKILRQSVEISAEQAVQASPELRKALLRKLRNRRIPRRDAKAFFAEVEKPPNLDEEIRFIDIDDVEVAEIFEILEESRGNLEAGSVVHKDAVEQFISDLPPEDRQKIVIVARVTDTLRCIFPEINGSKEEVETVTDGGSQIVAIDTVVAVGLGLTWDPESNILMQSANGQLQRTKGLARNVPFKFGEVTVYLQLHVVDEAPYQVLLGRPFDVLTSSSVQNFADGDQQIIVTCPNTGVKCTIPTYPRGGGKRIRPKVKDPILRPENAQAARNARESKEEEEVVANFRPTSRNC